jgi:hypothetical protein
MYFIFNQNYFLFPFTDAVLIKGLRITNSAFILFIVFSVFSYNKRKDLQRQDNIINWFKSIKLSKYIIIYDAMFLWSYFDSLSTIRKIGINQLFSAGIRRMMLQMSSSTSIQSKTQVFSALLDNFVLAYSCLIINQIFQRTKRQSGIDILMFIRGFGIFTYWSIYLILGGRIQLMSIILFIVISYWTINNNKIKKQYIIFGIISGLFFVCFGYFRVAGFVINANILPRLIFYSFGEFLNPIQGIYWLIDTVSSLQYGKTYLNIFLYLIPRAIYPNKPGVLAYTLSTDMGILRYSILIHPIVETFINFGIFSIFMMPLIYHSIFYFFEKISKKMPAIYIFMIFNIFIFLRSDIGFYFMSLIGVIISFLILPVKKQSH